MERQLTKRYPGEMDDEWKRSIALDYIDSTIMIDGDVDLDVLIDSLSQEDQELYKNEVAFAGHVRTRLIQENDFLDTDEISKLVATSGSGIEWDADSLRESGTLLGVRDHGQWIYPRFQFDCETGLPYEMIAEVQSVVSEGENPWATLSWWCSENPHLDGLRPSDLVADSNMKDVLKSAVSSAVTTS